MDGEVPGVPRCDSRNLVSKKRFVSLEGKQLMVSLGPESDNGEFDVVVGDGAEEASFRCSAKGNTALVDGRVFKSESRDGTQLVVTQGQRIPVHVYDRPGPVAGVAQSKLHQRHSLLRAPLPGQVVAVLVQEGENIQQGQRLVVIEAMKMQNPVIAERNGTVSRVYVKVNDSVQSQQMLVQLSDD